MLYGHRAWHGRNPVPHAAIPGIAQKWHFANRQQLADPQPTDWSSGNLRPVARPPGRLPSAATLRVNGTAAISVGRRAHTRWPCSEHTPGMPRPSAAEPAEAPEVKTEDIGSRTSRGHRLRKEAEGIVIGLIERACIQTCL